jgi:hypothetical protein
MSALKTRIVAMLGGQALGAAACALLLTGRWALLVALLVLMAIGCWWYQSLARVDHRIARAVRRNHRIYTTEGTAAGDADWAAYLKTWGR